MGPRSKLLAYVLALETCALSQPLATLRAQAESASEAASLNWVRGPGTEGCVDGAELARRVEARLKHPVFVAPREATLVVEGRVERKDDGFRAELRTFAAGGELLGSREVLSARPHCDELSNTVALVLAVMMDPAGSLSASAPVVAPVPVAPLPVPVEPPVVAPPPACAAPVPSREPEAAFIPEASVFARASYGRVPGWSWGGGAALELGFRRWGGVRLEGAALAERTIRLEPQQDSGTEVRVLYGSAYYCPVWWRHERIRLSACAGLAAGAIQSRGFGFDPSNDTLRPLIDGLVSARGAVALWRGFGVYLGSNLGVPFTRTRFEATLADGTQAELFEQGPVSVELDLGLGTRF